MVNKYYQKHKERLQREFLCLSRERYQNSSEEQKTKGEKKPKKDIKKNQNFTEEEIEKRS